jgi:hypothetical protein
LQLRFHLRFIEVYCFIKLSVDIILGHVREFLADFFGAILVATGVVFWKGLSGVEWSPEYIVVEMAKLSIRWLVGAVGEGCGPRRL